MLNRVILFLNDLDQRSSGVLSSALDDQVHNLPAVAASGVVLILPDNDRIEVFCRNPAIPSEILIAPVAGSSQDGHTALKAEGPDEPADGLEAWRIVGVIDQDPEPVELEEEILCFMA